MSARFDIVIRNATIVDGTGSDPFRGDIAIEGGKCAQVGEVDGIGAEEIDASGMFVTPGFVDIHSHYDGQITWEDVLVPSTLHGVTTVVMGNCGVGFAPVRRDDRETVVELMEGVEDIPDVVMDKGLPWTWETFPEFLEFLRSRKADADFAAQLPHSPLRVYVMGQRGVEGVPAGAEDLRKMQELTCEAVKAGALGVSTSRSIVHRFPDGRQAPSTTTDEEELLALSRGLRDAGAGVFQIIPNNSNSAADEFEVIRRLAKESGRPVSFSLLAGAEIAGAGQKDGGWRAYLTGLEQTQREELPILGQVYPRPLGVLFGLDLSYNPFSLNPSFRKIADLPLAEKVAAMRDPEFRRQLLSEKPESSNPITLMLISHRDPLFALGNPPNYVPAPENNISERAKVLGVSTDELIYDELLRDEGKAILYWPSGNRENGSYNVARDLLDAPGTVLGLSDGGAHYGLICDASYPTYMLKEFVFGEADNPLPLERAVSMLARETAAAVGLHDRGILAPGYKADLNIIDPENFYLHSPAVRADLPAGGRRLLQRADGYVATIVSGNVTYRNGRPTGARPGRFVDGGQLAPA